MAGINIGGSGIVPGNSLPYTLLDTDGNYNIWRVIGATPTNLTNFVSGDGVLAYSEKYNPVVSPDGSLIAYTVLNGDTLEWELWTVPGTGGTPVSIRLGSTEALMYPFWHPDSSHFLYSEGVAGEYGGDIRRMDADGSNDTLVLDSGSSSTWLTRPQYNSDGSLIVFARETSGPTVFTLRVCEDDGSNDTLVRTLVNYAQDGSQFAFANTSDRIAFWDGYDGITEGAAYTVDPDGTDLVEISDYTPDTIYRISKYSWLPDDSLVLGTAFVDATGPPTADHWFTVSMDPAGGTMTVLNDAHWAGVYLNRRQAWYWQGRLYFLEEGGVNPTLLVSILPDGTGYRVEQDAADPPVSNAFGDGAGPEYL